MCGALTSPIFTASSSAFSTEREEKKGLITPMDSDKQDSNEDRLVNLSNLFSNFIREREMLYGARPATIRFYRRLDSIRTLGPAYNAGNDQDSHRRDERIWLGCRWGKQLYQGLAGLLQLARGPWAHRTLPHSAHPTTEGPKARIRLNAGNRGHPLQTESAIGPQSTSDVRADARHRDQVWRVHQPFPERH